MSKFALCIGVDYHDDHGIRPLHHAARDANELASMFQYTLGFNTVVLTGAAFGCMSRDTIADAVRVIGEKLQEGDTFVFYFSGHGGVDDASEQYFLLPHASTRALKHGFWGDNSVLSFRELLAVTDHWVGVQRAFIMDTCRIGSRLANDGVQYAPVEFNLSINRHGVTGSPNRQMASLAVLHSCFDQPAGKRGYRAGVFTAALGYTLKRYIENKKDSILIDDAFVTDVSNRMQLLLEKEMVQTVQNLTRVGDVVLLRGNESAQIQVPVKHVELKQKLHALAGAGLVPGSALYVPLTAVLTVGLFEVARRVRDMLSNVKSQFGKVVGRFAGKEKSFPAFHRDLYRQISAILGKPVSPDTALDLTDVEWRALSQANKDRLAELLALAMQSPDYVFPPGTGSSLPDAATIPEPVMPRWASSSVPANGESKQ